MCHSPTAVIGKQGTKQWWQAKVTEMLQEVTDVPDSDVDTIVDYLAKNFPIVKINVNKASAKDLETGLELTSKESEAIVQLSRSQRQFQNARRSEKGARAGRRQDRIEERSTGVLMPPERFTVRSTDGVEISVQKAGSGPTLLLIHGALLNGSLSWGAVLPKLAEHFTVYAMDRRGRAPSGDAKEYSISNEADDIAAVVDAIGAPVIVLSHSYGALAALEALDRLKSRFAFDPL